MMSQWRSKAIESFAFLENRTIKKKLTHGTCILTNSEDFKDKT